MIRGRRAALLAIGLACAAFNAISILAAEPPPPPRTLAPGIHVFPGSAAAPDAANGGVVANVGVIVGGAAVVVIGTGTSDTDGERLLAELHRLTDLPVVLAIDTYAGPEHVLGNSAFARHGIALLAHRETDRYMVQNCASCIRNLATAVGGESLRGTRLERPTRLIDDSTTLAEAGRTLDILYFGATQQPGSIAVFDRTSGVLFAGGLASFDVVPDTHDADIDAWLAALRQLRRLPLTAVVPGRGPAGAPGRLDEVADYLAGLAQASRRAYDAGISIAAAGSRVELPRFERWAMYETTHRRNVHFQYLRLEAQELAGQRPAVVMPSQ